MKKGNLISSAYSNIEFWFNNFFFKPLEGATDGPPLRYSLEQRFPLAMLLILLRELYKEKKFKSILDISTTLKSSEILKSLDSVSNFNIKRQIVIEYLDGYMCHDGNSFVKKDDDYMVNHKQDFLIGSDNLGSDEKFDIIILSTDFLMNAFKLKRKAVVGIIQLIIDNNMSNNSRLILIDDFGILKESEPYFNLLSAGKNEKDSIEKFKEKNAYRLYGSIYDYTVEDIYERSYENGEIDKVYDDCETRFYILNSQKTKTHFVLRRNSYRDINYFGQLLKAKNKSIWIDNVFNENFDYPGNSWFDDDVFNWEPEYYTKSRAFWKTYHSRITELFVDEKIKYDFHDNIFNYQFKNEIYGKRKIEMEILKLEKFHDIKISDVLSFSLIRPESIQGSKRVYYPKFTINEFIEILDNDPFTALFLIKQNFKNAETDDYFDSKHVFKEKKFFDFTDFNENFAESIELIYSNKEADYPEKFDIISLDLTTIHYDEGKLYKFLVNALRLVDDKEKHFILIWVKEDVLASTSFQEFRDLYSNNISSIIKLNNSFLLQFQAGHQKDYVIANFNGEVKPYSNNNEILLKNKEFDLSLEKFQIKYDNKSLFVQKNDQFKDDWTSGFKTDHTVTVTNKDVLNKLTTVYKDLKGGQHAILSNQKKMLDEINEVKIQSKDVKESIEKYNQRVENAVDKILKIVEENKNINDVVVEDYIPGIKKWFNFWELLEKDSKLFMPRSEYLYDSIDSSDFDDYSPFVLYYSRVLEVELFQKIFKKFGILMRKKHDDISSLFEYDENISKETKEGIVSGPINSFKNKLLKDDPKYNLGDMRLILNLLPDSKKPKGSKRYQAIEVLKELDIFINGETGGLPKELILKIEKLISDFRNPSAHVGTIDKKKAKTFFENYKDLMNELIGLFNKIN